MTHTMGQSNDVKLVSFKSTHPGEIIRDWLEDIGIKQKEFAKSIGIPASRLNELIRGKRPLTEDDAELMENHLGMSKAYWMKLQAQYVYNEKMLAIREKEEISANSIEIALRGMFNLKELYDFLGIKEVSSIRRTSALFKKLDTTYTELAARTAVVGCFKHSDRLRVDEANLRTWVLMAQYAGSKESTESPYLSDKVIDAASKIATIANAGTIKEYDIKTILSEVGIKYAVVDYKMKGCPIDAYSYFEGGTPLVVVTHRHNNMEKLIFDVLHELGHIVKHMNEGNRHFINSDYSQSNLQESEANEFARDMLIPPSVWSKIQKSQVASLRPNVICQKIGDRAKELGVNPRIAVARYKHDSNMYLGQAYSYTKIM